MKQKLCLGIEMVNCKQIKGVRNISLNKSHVASPTAEPI